MDNMVGPRGSGIAHQCKEQPEEQIQENELITKDLLPALLKKPT